jgi:hypothetical protein
VTTTDVTFFILLNIVVFGIFTWIVSPIFFFVCLNNLFISPIFKLLILIYDYHSKQLFISKKYILYDIKYYYRWQRIIITMIDYIFKIFIFCFNQVPDHMQTDNMKRGYDMAIRAVDNRRVFEYIFEEERVVRDDRGVKEKNPDGSNKIMSISDALAIADQSEYTVVEWRGRTAREGAEERDRMLEVHSKGGEIVQRIHSGTMDFNLVTGSILNVRRLLAPEGHCIMCGVDHNEAGHVDSDGYFIYTRLTEFAKTKQGRKGSLVNEIILDHLDASQIAELAAAMRRSGGEGLGED